MCGQISTQTAGTQKQRDTFSAVYKLNGKQNYPLGVSIKKEEDEETKVK